MNTLINALNANPGVSDWKINTHWKESYELFFVKGSLETVRCTDTCDTQVTVYVDHEEFKGDAQFFVYPSDQEPQIADKIQEAVDKALLIRNKAYSLPGDQSGEYAVESNFANYEPAELAAIIANTVFDANAVENGSLNSVEIFINRHTQSIRNSRNLHKTQIRYDAMVEAIPTYNGARESVELYEQYNFSSLDEAVLRREIADKMAEVKARYEAVKPDYAIDCPVVLNALELGDLFRNIVYDLNYASVYSHSNLFSKGDAIQKEILGDPIGITMAGTIPGSVSSSAFDGDGLDLGSVRIVDSGRAVNYFGSNRYGQYLGEVPTGNLGCMAVDAGTAELSELSGMTCLEVISMSGLQVDFFSDYIGGEIRLAYLHENGKCTPVTGISISGKLTEILPTIRLSKQVCVRGGYSGPDKALLTGMKIF